MPTYGAGSSYRPGRRWQAEAEVWFSRSPATGFATQNFGVGLNEAFGL